MNTITINGKEHYEHHTSYSRGYVSVKDNEDYIPYEGRFGKGYTRRTHNPNSTTYCYITYYIEV